MWCISLGCISIEKAGCHKATTKLMKNTTMHLQKPGLDLVLVFCMRKRCALHQSMLESDCHFSKMNHARTLQSVKRIHHEENEDLFGKGTSEMHGKAVWDRTWCARRKEEGCYEWSFLIQKWKNSWQKSEQQISILCCCCFFTLCTCSCSCNWLWWQQFENDEQDSRTTKKCHLSVFDMIHCFCLVQNNETNDRHCHSILWNEGCWSHWCCVDINGMMATSCWWCTQWEHSSCKSIEQIQQHVHLFCFNPLHCNEQTMPFSFKWRRHDCHCWHGNHGIISGCDGGVVVVLPTWCIFCFSLHAFVCVCVWFAQPDGRLHSSSSWRFFFEKHSPDNRSALPGSWSGFLSENSGVKWTTTLWHNHCAKTSNNVVMESDQSSQSNDWIQFWVMLVTQQKKSHFFAAP